MRVVQHIKQLAGESMIYGLSGTATKLIAVLLIPLYTRVFTPADVGVLGLIDATINLASVIAVLGMDNASARWFYDSNDRRDRQVTISTSFWCQFVAGVILAAPLLIGAGPLSAFIAGEPGHAGLIWLAAITLPLLTYSRALSSWLRFQRRPWATMATTLSYSIARVGLVLLLVLGFHFRLEGVFTARLIAIAGLAVVTMILMRDWLRPSDFSASRFREMFWFGMPMIAAAAGMWINTFLDRFFLAYYWNQTEVGLYDLAARLATAAGLVVVAFQQAWSPFAYSIHEREESDRVYAGVLDVYGFLGSFVGAGIALFAPLVLRVMATEKFYTAASCLAPLVFVSLLGGARFIAALGSGIAKRSSPVAWSVGVSVILSVVLNLILIPKWGRHGAATSAIIASACGTAYLFAASQRLHRLPYRWRTSIASFALAWVLIGIAFRWVPEMTIPGLAIRAAMLLAFLPLGVMTGVIRWKHLRQLLPRA